MSFDLPPDGFTLELVQQWRVLQDICYAVRLADLNQSHVEWAIDHDRVLREIGTTPSTAFSVSSTLRSLENCLTLLSDFATRRRLRREKYILSVILTDALLQLHQSPWLTERWNVERILFLDDPSTLDPNSSSFGHMLRKPYISAPLHPPQGALPGALAHSNTVEPDHDKSCLFALGIILLELHLNRSIGQDIVGVPDVRVYTMDLLESCYQDLSMSNNYYDAVFFCLHPKPDPQTRRISFDEPGFRERYYEEVTGRLEAQLAREYDVGQSFWDSF